ATSGAAKQTQQQTFGEHLANKAATSCAKNRPHGEFVVTRHGASEQEVGHIGAANQENSKHRTEQKPGRQPGVLNLTVSEQANGQMNLFAKFGRGAEQSFFEERLKAGNGLGDTDAEFHARECAQNRSWCRAPLLRFI